MYVDSKLNTEKNKKLGKPLLIRGKPHYSLNYALTNFFMCRCEDGGGSTSSTFSENPTTLALDLKHTLLLPMGSNKQGLSSDFRTYSGEVGNISLNFSKDGIKYEPPTIRLVF